MVSKYVLILVILIAAIFIWRSNRKVAVKERKAKEQCQGGRYATLPLVCSAYSSN